MRGGLDTNALQAAEASLYKVSTRVTSLGLDARRPSKDSNGRLLRTSRRLSSLKVKSDVVFSVANAVFQSGLSKQSLACGCHST
eukprot:6364281-Amphidinium_carterae.1